jgi:SPP1 family predicted phage head-tail adaptor
MLSAGTLRELFAIEAPTETRNDLGESVQTWTEVGRRLGSYEASTYSEVDRRGQIGGSVTALVRIHYFAGLTGKHRLKWLSRDDRLLYISAVVEQDNRRTHELTVEEQAT